ncbi:unnamed protein product [Phaeothamnion confervicola]
MSVISIDSDPEVLDLMSSDDDSDSKGEMEVVDNSKTTSASAVNNNPAMAAPPQAAATDAVVPASDTVVAAVMTATTMSGATSFLPAAAGQTTPPSVSQAPTASAAAAAAVGFAAAAAANADMNVDGTAVSVAAGATTASPAAAPAAAPFPEASVTPENAGPDLRLLLARSTQRQLCVTYGRAMHGITVDGQAKMVPQDWSPILYELTRADGTQLVYTLPPNRKAYPDFFPKPTGNCRQLAARRCVKRHGTAQSGPRTAAAWRRGMPSSRWTTSSPSCCGAQAWRSAATPSRRTPWLWPTK